MKIATGACKIISLLFLIVPVFLLPSCGEKNNQQTEMSAKFETTTIEVDLSNKNVLAILLAKDGTINRKGAAVADTSDKDFFIGLTHEPVFDSLMKKVTSELLEYTNTKSPVCDTTRQTCKVTVSFGGMESSAGFTYCINGTMNDLPAPIKKYITDAINVTEPWYQSQKKMMKAK